MIYNFCCSFPDAAAARTVSDCFGGRLCMELEEVEEEEVEEVEGELHSREGLQLGNDA